MSKDSLEAAADTTKQIITLATGVLALTLTFADKFKVTSDAALTLPWQMYVCWWSMFLVVLAGVWTLLAITGSLDQSSPGSSGASNIAIPAVAMVIAFMAGLLFAILAVFEVVSDEQAQSSAAAQVETETDAARTPTPVAP